MENDVLNLKKSWLSRILLRLSISDMDFKSIFEYICNG